MRTSNFFNEGPRCINFNNSTKGTVRYGGSEKKSSIIYNEKFYMLKYPKRIDDTTFSNNCFSEYVGSHIFQQLGIEAHNTLLGIYDNSLVVACEDFVKNTGLHLIDFATTGESSYDIDKGRFLGYTYDNIQTLLAKHSKYVNPTDLVEFFWKLYVVDALLGNFDRHGMNWGFLKGEGVYKLAPVYDNGSCLFSRLQDNQLEAVLSSEDEMNKRIYSFPTSQIKIENKKSSYFDVISSKDFDSCSKAAHWLLDVYDRDTIQKIINEVPMISDIRKEFYDTMINARFNKIFKEVF